MLVDPDTLMELFFCPFPPAAAKSKTKVASCEVRWITGGPYTGPRMLRSDLPGRCGPPALRSDRQWLADDRRRSHDLLRVETHKRMVGQMFQPMAQKFSILIDGRCHRRRRVEPKFDNGFCRIALVNCDPSVDRAKPSVVLIFVFP